MNTRSFRLPRLAVACRLFILVLGFTGIVGQYAAAADATVSGVVVDQSGRPLPRALVRVMTSAGAELAIMFTDERGRFSARAGAVTALVVAAMLGVRSLVTDWQVLEAASLCDRANPTASSPTNASRESSSKEK